MRYFVQHSRLEEKLAALLSSYILEDMGRGQATTVRDHFSTVFGERRGSKDAQSERDREEAEILTRLSSTKDPEVSESAPGGAAESIPFDQCICGTRRKRPRSDCWASTHDCE